MIISAVLQLYHDIANVCIDLMFNEFIIKHQINAIIGNVMV
jgi:hypothetical protein